MILADTDVLSALAKIDRLSLLFALFQTPKLQISPGVFREIAHSLSLGRQYAEAILALIAIGQLEVISLTEEEATFCSTLPRSLGSGERESIAIARGRKGTVLSNESRVAHWCRQSQIPCVRLPDILRALWVENIGTKQEVRDIIADLQVRDRMQFKQGTIDAIFAE